MARYTYIAKLQPFKAIQGVIEAESEQDAINKLSDKGCFPIFIQPESLLPGSRGSERFSKISSTDIAIFTRQLASLLAPGVSILKSFNIILSQTSNKNFKFILLDISGAIKDGKSLSESLTVYPKLFSELYVSMVEAGEAGGNLEGILKRIADFLEKEVEFKSSLRAALVYPSFIFTVSVITVTALLAFVIPRLTMMFEDMGQVLPLSTRILIEISGFLRYYWHSILIIIIIAVLFARRLHAIPKNKLPWDSFKLKLPVFGELIFKTEASRLTRTLSFLLSSGMPILSALDKALAVLGNTFLKHEMQKFKGQISEGLNFSQVLKNSNLFPAFMINIISLGEESGTLENSLVRIAEDYERDIDRSLKVLTQMLEPLIILVMGIIVGFIVLSMLLPIFQINLIVK